tara:strand:+ start:499 stop:1329 length:831 start_codon:yes stop_codon:yes gene_type:complete
MVKLNIKIYPISFKLEKKLSKYIVISGNYRELNDKHLNLINKYIKNKPIDINTILSMRSAYMNIKNINNHSRIRNNANEFLKLYKKGITISEISKEYDLSPMGILRSIFEKMNYSKEQIKNMFLMSENLSEFDVKQIEFVKKYDIFNKLDQSNQANRSEEFELLIEKFLIKNNVKYKTQNQLSKEQIKKFGRPVNTPDFLIQSELFINNKKINWIDAKNFYGANTFLINKKINKQIKKYVKSYGFGSIIFSLNFSEMLHFHNVLLIDYKNLTKIEI